MASHVNYGHQLKRGQSRSLTCNKYTTAEQDVNNGRNRGEGPYGSSAFSLLFFCKPKTALEIKSIRQNRYKCCIIREIDKKRAAKSSKVSFSRELQVRRRDQKHQWTLAYTAKWRVRRTVSPSSPGGRGREVTKTCSRWRPGCLTQVK